MSEPTIERPQIGNGSVSQFSNPVTLSYARREVTMHTVTENELDTVASLSNSVDLAFTGICGGGFLTLAVTLATVTLTSPITSAGFVSATIISGLGTLFFGIKARISYKEAQEKLKDIKKGSPMPQR
jgi:hypothetical protein